MDSNPVKVIYKYNNNLGIPQYALYIYIGKVNKSLMKVLKKIESLSYKESIDALNKEDLSILVKKYGTKWYLYFFTNEHMRVYGSKVY